jgi:hypothetical protein
MSRIRTYEDLEAEEKRLQALLYSHKENIKDSFAAVKQGLNPFAQAANTIKKLFSRDKSNPLVLAGVGLGVDVLLRRFVLTKSGWITKIVIPFFIKNYSTHFINEYKKNRFLQKIGNFFKPSKSSVKETAQEVVKDVAEGVKQAASNIT